MRIALNKAGYSYNAGTPRERQALKEISLTIEPGDTLALAGASGSGKSTLMQLLNGLLLPVSGDVCWDDQGIGDIRLRQLRQKVALLFQFPETQLFEETVAADVQFGLKNMGMEPSLAIEQARKALRLVGLDSEKYWNRSPFNLSGGEQKKVALSGILAMDPRVLALDEPTASLDASSKRELVDILNQYHRTSGCSLILVSHDLQETMKLCDRIAVLHEGSLVFDGDWESLPLDALESWGIETPECLDLANELRKKKLDIPFRISDPHQLAELLVGAPRAN